MDDLDIPQKLVDSAERVIDGALRKGRRREQPLLTNEHVFLGFAQVEWTCSGTSSGRPRPSQCRWPGGTEPSREPRFPAWSRLTHESREETSTKRLELPPFLSHFATNLNQ